MFRFYSIKDGANFLIIRSDPNLPIYCQFPISIIKVYQGTYTDEVVAQIAECHGYCELNCHRRGDGSYRADALL